MTRERLLSSDVKLRSHPFLLVQAPAGFGKTSLLAQWRREHLGRGAVVAWLSAQAHDDPLRLVQALVLAVRVGAGRPAFGSALLDGPVDSALEGTTTWLAELAQLAFETVLIVDEAERLPGESVEVLAYLMRNAPPNLRVVVAARAALELGVDDLMDYGQCLVIGASTLRFELNETLALVSGRFGSRVDQDVAARMHELVEGWPLGLQLALAVISSGNDPRTALAALAAGGGALREQLVGLLLANLNPADVNFLAKIAIADHLQPELCRAISESDDAAERLARLSRDTPLLARHEHGHWSHMHSLAREALRQRVALLPGEQQAGLHARAAAWLADHGFLEEAARHALSSGQKEMAYALAERGLYEAVMARGRYGAVFDWLGMLPDEELDRRPRLLLATAWSLAPSDRREQAGRLVARILARPDVSDALRCECGIILSGVAVFTDDPDRLAALHAPWSEGAPLRDQTLQQMHVNRSTLLALQQGKPALARLRQQQGPLSDSGLPYDYHRSWRELLVGLSYLWEGQVLLAEAQLRPALTGAEADLGRRAPMTCMVASLLATALLERDNATEAAALLANRLDVLEHSGMPEALLLGYRTMARIALASGAEHRSLELLGALHAVGVSRSLPRLCIASLAEQVRIHARRYRAETCRDLVNRIDELTADPTRMQAMWRRSVELLSGPAHVYEAIAAQDWRRALDLLEPADALAQQMEQHHSHIELLGLRALALDRCGERSQSLLREAADLAQTYGLLRVFRDVHPALEDLVLQLAPDGPDASSARAAPMRASAQRPNPVRTTPSMALTPKEREVLALLARALTNKEMALAMQVSEEAIKWHMKNLFAKLDAGTRKQVVQRARILGLLEGTD
ncbi:LuxR C-terminal-related transcriptional regulator [Variovorax sp. HW608]|uniref:LuxR C-terminal-related transcriptional regulator n=1 Tax=Variovorax sp. HW608 TaxID=1034889 RepID=UPI001E5FECB7|nr:LuxR C-terminal-related transcriptional regulator [Variovorax sp. HW608]